MLIRTILGIVMLSSALGIIYAVILSMFENWSYYHIVNLIYHDWEIERFYFSLELLIELTYKEFVIKNVDT